MKAIEQRKAATKFAKDWAKKKGNEKKETQKFWNDLLESVYGVKGVRDFIFYEDDVKVGNATKWIDASIPTTKVFIEQKSKGIDLNKKIRQSGDIFLTPYEQAKRYADSRPNKKRPDWIVTCNFTEFHIHNLNSETPELYDTVMLCDLPEEYGRMKFLQDITDTNTYKEVQVSRQAGELIGEIYDRLLEQYGKNPTEYQLHQLNILCVRLVFCLYAEDADIFDNNAFLNYLSQYPADQLREKLLTLFDVLNTPRDKRSPFLDEKLKAFPWVNGGLFESGIDVPPITDEVRTLLLDKASRRFNWRNISPTIFGAMFESTLNPETRHDGGMHYTSIENIHKVIDPLFLDDLRNELDGILKLSMEKTRKQRLAAFQQKLGSIRCLDPACGSGNFLTETYMSLRELENRAIAARYNGRLNAGLLNPIEVNISQFYGIEINDFAVAVAKTAMWIAEYQMWAKTMSLVVRDDSEDDEDGFLPLKSYNNIHQGNALLTEWQGIVPSKDISYIIGNPPFLGARVMDKDQKEDLKQVFGKKHPGVGDMDYVCGWYRKCADYMEGTSIRAALVSTNSVSQGSQVPLIWKPLAARGMKIDFAWRSFLWKTEGKKNAHVHCVIEGFSYVPTGKKPMLYDEEGVGSEVAHINGYLIDMEDVFVENREEPLFPSPEIGIGNKPVDNGNYLFKTEEMEEFIALQPESREFFRLWYGSDEFIRHQPRHCLWLGECTPSQLAAMPHCKQRVEAVRAFRSKSTDAGTRKLADRPRRFHVENLYDGNYMVIPKTSSEKRDYIPMGFVEKGAMCSDAVFMLREPSWYHFAILTSGTHMAWMRAIGGRLKSDYRYSKGIVYCNFPWPEASEKDMERLSGLAQEIDHIKNGYMAKDETLRTLYDRTAMPDELLAAHKTLDRAVLKLYGLKPDTEEADIVRHLLELYKKIINDLSVKK